MMHPNKSEKYVKLASFGMGPYVMKNLKVCPKCGQIASSRALVCRSCKKILIGRTLFDHYQTMHAHCPACDIPLAGDARYCPHCGRKISVVSNK